MDFLFQIFTEGWKLWLIVGILFFLTMAYMLGTFATREVLKYTEHDPKIVVIDETVGMLVSLLPFAERLHDNMDDWWIYMAAFFLFRFFDI